MGIPLDMQSLRKCLEVASPAFEAELTAKTTEAREFAEVLQLCTLRKRALLKGLMTRSAKTSRLAVVGAANMRPLVDFIEHFAAVLGHVDCETWVGEYDNYHAEIMNTDSPLYEFKPDAILLLPSERRCVYNGPLGSSRSAQEDAGQRAVSELLDLCKIAHENSGAEVIVGNFRLPPYFDPGPMRNTSFDLRLLVSQVRQLRVRSEIAELCPYLRH